MHPENIAEQPGTPCPKCGMALHNRRIPYSFVYTKPREPSLKLTAAPAGPVVAGRPLEVKVQLATMAGSPVLLKDLMVLHTGPIHLLIEEPGLADYHHEHPVPTGTPGEYAFFFTPAKPGPYRIWADVMPVASGVQELPSANLPAAGPVVPPWETADKFVSNAGGY